MKFLFLILSLIAAIGFSFLAEWARVQCQDMWWNGVVGLWSFMLALACTALVVIFAVWIASEKSDGAL